MHQCDVLAKLLLPSAAVLGALVVQPLVPRGPPPPVGHGGHGTCAGRGHVRDAVLVDELVAVVGVVGALLGLQLEAVVQRLDARGRVPEERVAGLKKYSNSGINGQFTKNFRKKEVTV